MIFMVQWYLLQMWGAQSSSPVSSVNQTRFREHLGEKGKNPWKRFLKKFGFNHKERVDACSPLGVYSEGKGFVSGFLKTI